MCQNFILFYNWIILHCNTYTTFYISLYHLVNIWGCIYFGVIMNNAIVDIYIWGFAWTMLICLGFIPGNGISRSFGHSCVWLLIQLTDCFPSWLHNFTFSQAIYKGSSLFYILTHICYCLSYVYGHPIGGGMIIH
jgi:hypothetical protein